MGLEPRRQTAANHRTADGCQIIFTFNYPHRKFDHPARTRLARRQTRSSLQVFTRHLLVAVDGTIGPQQSMASTVPDAPLRVAIVGGGSFGSVMARVVASAAAATPARFESTVAWWVRREEQAAEICSQRTNVAYLGSDCALPDNLHATTDLAQALRGANVVVLGVPLGGTSYPPRYAMVSKLPHYPRDAMVSLCGERGKRGGRGGRGEPAWPGCRPCGSRRCERGTPLLGRRLPLSLRLQPQSRPWLPHQSRHSHASAALEPASSCSLCQVCRISS